MPDQLVEKPPKPTVELHYQRPKRSWRARFRADYRHWVRRTFSRESYVASLKALLWVVPLSALIWSYAFNEQFVPTPTLTAHLELEREADRVVRFARDEQPFVQVQFEGPQKGVSVVEDYLRGKAIRLNVDRSLGEGRHTITLSSALNQDSEILAAGMTVKKCDPPEIVVDIDRIDSKPVDVRIRPDEATGIVAVFDPPRVKIFGPSRDLQNIPSFVYANLKQDAPQLAQPGEHVLGTVQLEGPTASPDAPFTLSQTTVKATVNVSGNQVPYTFDYLPVYKSTPDQQRDDYRVVFDPTVQNVKVVGPQAAIDAIKAHTLQVAPKAEFEVDFTNPNTPRTAVLRYVDLPEGVTVVDKTRKISYSVVNRTTEQ